MLAAQSSPVGASGIIVSTLMLARIHRATRDPLLANG